MLDYDELIQNIAEDPWTVVDFVSCYDQTHLLDDGVLCAEQMIELIRVGLIGQIDLAFSKFHDLLQFLALEGEDGVVEVLQLVLAPLLGVHLWCDFGDQRIW